MVLTALLACLDYKPATRVLIFLENKADGGNTRHRFSFLMSRGSRNEDVRLIDQFLLLRVNGYGRVR